MSILDDAIREHLELKRAHGADESELKKLEDEAFGPPQRPDEPDPFAEAPTEFLTAPGEGAEGAADVDEGGGRRVPNITDLQEGPPPPQESESAESVAPPSEPSIEEQPAMEHEAISEPAADAELESEPTADNVHTTEEREAIADQPTEFFDVAAELDTNSEAASPSDEELVDAGIAEPRLAPVDPLSGIEASGPEPEVAEEEEEDFFSEQRLSEELDNALEAPIPITEEHEVPPPAAAPTEEGTAIFDVEADHEDDYEDEPESESDEHPAAAAPEPDSEEHPVAAAEPEPPAEPNVFEPETGSHDDVLEDTPDFLENAPEDDDLWFEQKPPKDFDFDD
jgi:hypothetical protein